MHSRWQRRMHRKKQLQLESDYSRGVQASYRVYREPIDAHRPFRPQEYEVGFDTSWSTASGDGVAAEFEAGSRLGGAFATLTGNMALDAQRHTSALASASLGTDQQPSFKLELEDRQHNLLLGRRVQQSMALDATPRSCQLTSSSKIKCFDGALALQGMAGTDWTNTDVSLEAVLSPQEGSRQPLNLRRAQLSGVVSLDGVGKELCIESSHNVGMAGAKLEVSLESREEAGLARLLAPERWRLEYRAPTADGAKSVVCGLRGGRADGSSGVSVRMSPSSEGSGDGLSLGAAYEFESRQPRVEVEWRRGTEERWLAQEDLFLLLNAEIRGSWSSSKAGFDLLMPL